MLPSTHSEVEGSVELVPLEVTGLALPAGEAVRCLVELPDGPLRLGDDFLFWRLAARLALEFMARERIIPVLGHNGDTAVGRWVPLLQGEDRRRFSVLAESMPRACRAVASEENGDLSQSDILFEFLAYAVDQLARGWLVERYSGGRGSSSSSEGASAALKSWISSLTAENPRPVPHADRIEGAVVQWLGPLFETPDALGFRTCLRLRPPKEGNDEWTLTFILQSADDPTKLVPAGQVWRERGRQWDEVKEQIPASSGEDALRSRAGGSRLSSNRQRAEESAPRDRETHVQEAYTFLREAAPILEESDVAVMAPGWWSRRRTGLAWRVEYCRWTRRT